MRKDWGISRFRTPWEMDHKVPLVEGGLNEMENLRTLCVPCHKKETAALRQRLAIPKQPKPSGWHSVWPRD